MGLAEGRASVSMMLFPLVVPLEFFPWEKRLQHSSTGRNTTNPPNSNKAVTSVVVQVNFFAGKGSYQEQGVAAVGRHTVVHGDDGRWQNEVGRTQHKPFPPIQDRRSRNTLTSS